MMIQMIKGATRVIGRSQGYIGLPLRDEVIKCAVGGEGTPAMVSAWQPTPDELAALNSGASVHLRVLGVAHPPVMVFVGPIPAETDPIPAEGGGGGRKLRPKGPPPSQGIPPGLFISGRVEFWTALGVPDR